MNTRRRLCRLGLCAGTVASALLGVSNSLAQNYPDKPIRMIVGFTAGSTADVTARIAAQGLTQLLGQQVLVDIRAGASGTIADGLVAKASADGYTLLAVTTASTVSRALIPNLSYDLVRDFAPIAMTGIAPQLLAVKASLPAQNVRELIALAQSQPGKLTYATSGVGTLTHLAGELFKFKAKVDILHVPYKGGAETATAIASGEVDVSYPSIPAAVPLVESGKIRALAVSGPKRASAMSTVPTFDELGLSGYDRVGFYGVLAPAATPRDIVARLHGALTKYLATPEARRALNAAGAEPQPMTPEELADFIRRQAIENGDLVRATGAKLQ
jgi:tripartite-type tricarboxylate transporter receptor subunit TctC